MKITINFKWIFPILIIGSYILNFYLMQTGTGLYNNDPQYRWEYYQGKVQKTAHGPSLQLRTTSFALSPITAPICGMASLVEKTYE